MRAFVASLSRARLQNPCFLRQQYARFISQASTGLTGLETSAPLPGLSYRQRLSQLPIDDRVLERILKIEVARFRGRQYKKRYKREVVSPKRNWFAEWLCDRPLQVVGRLDHPSSHLPHTNSPQIAFAGRSNVGKSCLLNRVFGRHGGRIAVDDRPGTTRHLQLMDLGPGLLRVVDMPGYGFAYAKEELLEQWKQTISNFLEQHEHQRLKCVYVLLDARHGPKPSDREFWRHLERLGIPFRPILTKADLVEAGDLARRATSLLFELSTFKRALVSPTSLLVVSNLTGRGVNEVQSAVCEVMPRSHVRPLQETFERKAVHNQQPRRALRATRTKLSRGARRTQKLVRRLKEQERQTKNRRA